MKKILITIGVIIVLGAGAFLICIKNPFSQEETMSTNNDNIEKTIIEITGETMQENNIYLAKDELHYAFIVKNTKVESFPKRPNAFLRWTDMGRDIVGAGSGLAGETPLKNTKIPLVDDKGFGRNFLDIAPDGDTVYLMRVGYEFGGEKKAISGYSKSITLIKKYTVSTNQLEDFITTDLVLGKIYDIQGKYLLTHKMHCYECDDYGPHDVILIDTKTKEIITIGKVVDVSISDDGNIAYYSRLYLKEPSTGCDIGLNPFVISISSQREMQQLSAG